MKKKMIFIVSFLLGFLTSCSTDMIDVKLYYDEINYFDHDAYVGEKQKFEVYEKFGYDFIGYFSESGNQYSDELGVGFREWTENDPNVLFAKYEAKTYTINFELNGGTLESNEIYNIKYDSDISYLVLPIPYKSGYTFMGYYTAEKGGNQITDGNTNFVYNAKLFNKDFYSLKKDSNDVIFYAIYEEKLATFYLNGINENYSYRVGEELDSLPYEIKDNYCFIGYYYDSEFQKKVEYPLVVEQSERTIDLYPRYEKGTDKGLSFANDTDKSYIANFDGDAESLVIPDTYMGTPITKIGNINAFNASYIYVPQTVTAISDEAFMDCVKLKEISLSDNIVEIPNKCFYNCEKLEVINLNNKIENIKENAFYNCRSIITFNLPRNLKNISKGAFVCTMSLKYINVSEGNDTFFTIDNVLYSNKSSTSIQLIKYPTAKEGTSYVIDERTSKINDYAFSYCSLKKIEGGSKIVSIGEGAFYSCSSLIYFKIINGTRLSISKLAFSECKVLSSIIFDVSTMVILSSNDVFLNSYEGCRIFVPNSTYSSYLIDTNWQLHMSKLTRMTMIFGDYCIDEYEDGVIILSYLGTENNLVIPDYINGKSVLAIGENAFIFNEYIEKLELNKELKIIQNNAFKYCDNLSEVYINGDFLKIIEGEPFEMGTNFFLNNNSDDLLDEYKKEWLIYKDYIWTAN